MGSQGKGQDSWGEGRGSQGKEWGSQGEGWGSWGEGQGSQGERWGSQGKGRDGVHYLSLWVYDLSAPHRVVITKLDILDTFKEIKIGVSYTLDGKPVESMPGEASSGRV